MIRGLAIAALSVAAIVGTAAQGTNAPTATTVPAEPAPPAGPPEPSRSFCDQNVAFHLAAPDSVAEPYRHFIGVWSDAAWDAHTCAALIVENVTPDGTATILYAFGPLGSTDHVAGGVLNGTGVIRDGELRFQNADGTQFAFRPGIVDLVGKMTPPKGETLQSTFKQTF